MSLRQFQIIRRRKNLIDVVIPKQAGVQGYRLRVATNFDAVYSDLLTAPISSGWIDSTIPQIVLQPLAGFDHVRAVFDPDNYTGLGIADDQQFWMQFQPVDFSGTPGTATPGVLVLTDDQMAASVRVTIHGNAPNAADVSGSLELDLPRGMQDLQIRNNEAAGGSDLYVAFAPGAPEMVVGPGQFYHPLDGLHDALVVRGGGTAVDFSASFTNYLPL